MDPGRAIVFLSNEHANWQTFQLAIQGFREAVEQSQRPLVLYEEFLDTSRFPRAVRRGLPPVADREIRQPDR